MILSPMLTSCNYPNARGLMSSAFVRKLTTRQQIQDDPRHLATYQCINFTSQDS